MLTHTLTLTHAHILSLIHRYTTQSLTHMLTHSTYIHTYRCTSTHSHILSHTHTPYPCTHTCSLMQSCTNSFSRTHSHSHTHSHTSFCCTSPSPTRLAAYASRTAQASSDVYSLLCFPSWSYLFFLATMSIFGKGSIFTLSGNTFPLSHELGRSVRRLLATVAWAGRAKTKPGWRPESHKARGLPEVVCCL